MNVAPPVSASTLVIAAVSDVFPWSTCPIVPTLQCGFVRSNFAFAIVLDPVFSHGPAAGASTLGAGGGNRTRIASLEGWSSTTELHPRFPPSFLAIPAALRRPAGAGGGGRIRTY